MRFGALGISTVCESKPMSLEPLSVPVCGIIGCISGYIAGVHSDMTLGIIGAVGGLAIGVTLRFVVIIPYVWWVVHYYPDSEPPALWRNLDLPLLLLSLISSAIIPFFIFSSK